MTVWTSLSPTIIQRSIQCKQLLKSVKDVIKSQISSSIPLEYHITAMARQATPPDKRKPDEPRSTYFDCPIPNSTDEQFEDHVFRVINSTSIHQHSPTCTKGPLGHIGCRLSYPSGCSKGNDVTIKELILKTPKNSEVNLKNKHSKIDLEYRITNFENNEYVNYESKNLI